LREALFWDAMRAATLALFFYAGARALLVSHWPVDSEAAVKLTTAAFSELARNPAIGRAEALRRSMQKLIADRSLLPLNVTMSERLCARL
jgi:CHAT domain-containing protein